MVAFYSWPLFVQASGDIAILHPELVYLNFSRAVSGSYLPTTNSQGYTLTHRPDGLFHLQYGHLTFNYNTQNALFGYSRRSESRHESFLRPPSPPLTASAPIVTGITDSAGRTYSLTWTRLTTDLEDHEFLREAITASSTSSVQNATSRSFTYYNPTPHYHRRRRLHHLRARFCLTDNPGHLLPIPLQRHHRLFPHCRPEPKRKPSLQVLLRRYQRGHELHGQHGVADL